MTVMPGQTNVQPQDQPQPYDWRGGIQRRFDTINSMGADALASAQDRANAKLQNSLAAQRQATQDTNNAGFNYTPQDSVSAGGNGLRNRIVNLASQFKGVNYQWGGESPKGFDCSGLVQYVYGKMGVKMPRVSQQQATMGRMTNVNSLKQGDLVAWGNSPATAHHIAIYAGNGMIWEAPHTGAQVRLRRISPNEAGIMGISLGI